MDLVILDRDGVINEEREDFVKSVDEWHPIPGALEAIARLSRAGFRVVVASNQSGLARGLFDIAALNEIHALLHRRLVELGGQLAACFFCPHDPEDGCECRKPRPGLYRDIARRLRVSLHGVHIVGDRPSDIEAARAVAARPVFVRTGRPQDRVLVAAELHGAEVYDDLAAFVDHLLAPLDG
jgi:D-glycero-D-manno-heptose 1,7-bisphosphate phosphatase